MDHMWPSRSRWTTTRRESFKQVSTTVIVASPSSYDRPIKSAFVSVSNSTRLDRNGRVICLALMKTSLGDDHALFYLDYDAVKEVVLIYRVCRRDYGRSKLRSREPN